MMGLAAYPRSFGRLLWIGFVLVATPAILGVLTSAISVTQLAGRGERAVVRSVQNALSERRLGEALVGLERNARQFAIVSAPEWLEAYDTNRKHLYQAIADIELLDPDADERAALAEVRQLESDIHEALMAPRVNAKKLAPALEKFVQLREKAGELRAAGERRTAEEAEALRQDAERARSITLWQLAGLIPVMIFLVGGFTTLIGRPIRQLDRAIRRLGRGQLAEPVAVQGTEDLEELGRRLDWMREQLIDLEREKNRFLREISHALKTPLTALREGAELLGEEALGKLNDEQREVVDILRRQSHELQQLIAGLLQYEAAQFQRTVLDTQPTQLTPLVEQVLDNHALAARARSLHVERAIEPLELLIDAGKIRAILDNLLSNAIKYSPAEGSVAVQVRYMEGKLVLDVEDQGPGIPPEERAAIFEPFVRGRALPSGRVEGSGVGLSIVREHAQAHGGKVELVSGDSGAHMRVTIPAERSGH
ncbi:MAG: HAMP domain-containing histidine kinase [Rhodocyclaceae bacterium]|nr:HAMP domain-containing histidine kinase [Rhodocyclaceae bacterium]MBX3669057.1 HAMP domain-containing histidine kinase [Rhodocyclaceae bacterium]